MLEPNIDREYLIYRMNDFCEELGIERVDGLEKMSDEELEKEFEYYSDILDK